MVSATEPQLTAREKAILQVVTKADGIKLAKGNYNITWTEVFRWGSSSSKNFSFTVVDPDTLRIPNNRQVNADPLTFTWVPSTKRYSYKVIDEVEEIYDEDYFKFIENSGIINVFRGNFSSNQGILGFELEVITENIGVLGTSEEAAQPQDVAKANEWLEKEVEGLAPAENNEETTGGNTGTGGVSNGSNPLFTNAIDQLNQLHFDNVNGQNKFVWKDGNGNNLPADTTTFKKQLFNMKGAVFTGKAWDEIKKLIAQNPNGQHSETNGQDSETNGQHSETATNALYYNQTTTTIAELDEMLQNGWVKDEIPNDPYAISSGGGSLGYYDTGPAEAVDGVWFVITKDNISHVISDVIAAVEQPPPMSLYSVSLIASTLLSNE